MRKTNGISLQFITILVAIVALFVQEVSSDSQERERKEPLALHHIYEVSVGGEQVISLKGRNFSGKKTRATIISPPTSGTLYHLSSVFDQYGYEPKKGAKITSVPVNITSNDSRVLYLRPIPDREPLGR